MPDGDPRSGSAVYIINRTTEAVPVSLGAGAVEVDLAANIGLLDSADAVIDPSAAYAEDTAHTSGDYATPAGAVRSDARASLAGTDGDYTIAQATANGDIRVRDDDANTDLDTIAGDTTSLDAKVPAQGTAAMAASLPVTLATDDTQLGSSADAANATGSVHAKLREIAENTQNIEVSVETIDNSEIVDDAAFTPATSSVKMIGATFDDTAPDSVDEGDGGALRMSARRELYSQIRDAAGGERGANVDASNQLAVRDADANTDLDTIAGDTTSIDGKITACDTGAVTIGAELPAGTQNIGDVDVASIAAGDNNIGNVDMASLPAGNLGQQLSAASLSVTPATDVADGTYIGDIKFGEALPAGTAAIGKLAANDGVDIGDVTINNAGGVEVVQVTAADLNMTEANSAAIKTAVELIDNAIAGSEMQVDVVAALPAGTNAIGKLAANSGVDIGDVDVTSLPGALQGPGNPSIDSYGDAVVDVALDATEAEIAAPGASKQLWVYGLVGTTDTADATIVLKSATTAKTGAMPFADNGGFCMPPSGNFAMPWLKCATNEAFQITTVGGTFDGIVTYAIVSV